MLDIFSLSMLELQREGITINNPKYVDLFIDYVKKIRRYLDLQARNKKVLVNRYK